MSLDQSAMGRRPSTLKTGQMQPSIEEDGESAGWFIKEIFTYIAHPNIYIKKQWSFKL